MLRGLIKEFGIKVYDVIMPKDVDRYKFPTTRWVLDEENIEKFNKIYQYCLDELEEMILTPKGSISHAKENLHINLRSYSVVQSGGGVSLMVIADRMGFCLSIGSKVKAEGMNGSKAFTKFKKICAKYGIDLSDYAVSKEEGLAAKDEIDKAMIWMRDEILGETIDNVHHIDFHSSYPAGLVNTHPEFKPVIDELYSKRKTNPEYKAIMNLSIGYMQSKFIGFKYARLSRDAMNDNNRRINDLTLRLEHAGRDVLGFNTDGIWYRGDVFHDAGEGENYGQWSNDKHAVMFRAYSSGAYEYVDEEFKVNVVLRGLCSYDKVEPDRSKWKWGDMKNKKMIIFAFDEEYGFRIIDKEDI